MQRAAAGDIPHFEAKVASKGQPCSGADSHYAGLRSAGAVPGMNIVADRKARFCRRRQSRHWGQRLHRGPRLTAFILSLVNTAVGLDHRKDGRDGQMMVAAASSAAVTLLMALLLGCSADNQIAGAIASIKLIMPAGLVAHY